MGGSGLLDQGRILAALALTGSVLVAEPQKQTFQARTDLVQTDAVVTDAHGAFVTGLTAVDFTIVDDGRRHPVSQVEFVSIPLANRTLEVDAAVGPVPLIVASNDPVRSEGRAFAIIIDDLHLIAADIVPVKRLLLHLLSDLSPVDEVAVVYVNRSDLSHDFTRDVRLLRRSVDWLGTALGFGLDAMPFAIGNAGETVSFPHAKQYADSSLLVLENAVRALARATVHRKAAVYVSGGIHFDTRAKMDSEEFQRAHDLAASLQRLYSMARSTGVHVYTVDPRGAPAPETAVANVIDLNSPRVVQAVRDNIGMQQAYLREMASNTDALAAVNRADLDAAIDDISADNGTYYVLGYYPNPYPADGKFHAIKVQVNRPGLHVRARAGYVAPKPGEPVDPADRDLDHALADAFSHGDVRLAAFAAPMAGGDGRVRTALTLEATYPHTADRTTAANGQNDQIEFRVNALDGDGKPTGSIRREFKVTLPAHPGADLRFLIDDTLELPVTTRLLRFGVSSQWLDRIGTVYVPVVPEELATGSRRMSEIILGVDGGPPEPVVRSAELAALVPFQPTTRRTFGRDEKLRLFARLFPGEHEAAPTVQATIRRLATGEAEAHPLIPARSSVAGALDCTIAVPLKTLTPGPYEFLLEVTFANGTHVTKVVRFEIQ